MTRLLGFLIEGLAGSNEFRIIVVVPDHIRDEAEADLRTLNAVYHRDFELTSPRDQSFFADSFAELADFANDHLNVDAWLTLFPTFRHAKRLNAPVTTIFPDAIPDVFHEFTTAAWGSNGDHVRWRQSVEELLAHAQRVITFSDHVARTQVAGTFNVPKERIVVIPHASPDLSPLLGMTAGTDRNEDTVRYAADRLRALAGERGLAYLRGYPFEQVSFAAVSTQDRVTKNLRVVARAGEIILKDRRADAKVFLTAHINYGSDWTGLPALISERMTQVDIVSMPDLPRREHAALLHAATVVVHPSIFEGGHAPFPFFEALSVGTPCLMAYGPHLAEAAEAEPDILNFSFDPNDAHALATMIQDVFKRRDEYFEAQYEIYNRLKRVKWSEVALAYARAATERPS